MNKKWINIGKKVLCYILILTMVFDSNTASMIASAQQVTTTSEEEKGDTASSEDADEVSSEISSETKREEQTSESTNTEEVSSEEENAAASSEEATSEKATEADTVVPSASKKTTKAVMKEDTATDGAAPMALSNDEEEGDYVLYLGDKALNAGVGDNYDYNFDQAVTVKYGVPFPFVVKNNKTTANNLEVYYCTTLKFKDNNQNNDIVVEYNNVIGENTRLNAGNYYLFYTTNEAEEIGKKDSKNGIGGKAKYILRVKPVTLSASTNLRWGIGEDSMVAQWDAVTTDANGRTLTAGTEVVYQLSLYYGDETTPCYTSGELKETSLNLSTEIEKAVSDAEDSGKGYGDYSFTVTASVKSPMDQNYNVSTSEVSESYHYSDTVKPKIKSYGVIDGEEGKVLQGTAVDAGTGIAAYAFAPKNTSESAITWTTLEEKDIMPGTTGTFSVPVSTAGAGEICFYVKDKDGNIRCQTTRLSDDGVAGAAVFISKVTGEGYYNGNTTAIYEQYLVDGESLTLPEVSGTELVRTGYVFGGWYGNEACTGTAVTTLTPGTTDGFNKGSEYTVYAKWQKQTVSFAEQPQDVTKTYDATESTLTAALANNVTYDSVSWTWYYKASETAEPEPVEVSRVAGRTERSTTCKVKNVADSGIYYASATLTIGEEEQDPVSSNTAVVTISKRKLLVKVANKTITYQDEAPNYTFEEGNHSAGEGLVGGDTIEDLFGAYEEEITCTYQQGDPVTSESVKYPITYGGELSSWNVPNYKVSLTDTGYLTVKAMDPTKSFTVSATLSETTFTYDQQAKEPKVTSLFLQQEGKEDVALVYGADKDYTYSYQNNTLAGQTDTAVVIHFCGNYTGTYEVPFTIQKGTYAVNTTMTGWKYGDTANEPKVDTLKDSGTATYYYLPVAKDEQENYISDEAALTAFNADGFDTTGATTTRPVNAGKYYVWAVISATDNYEKIQAAPAVFTISKRQITITPESKTWPYDGNVHTAGSITDEQIDGDGFVGQDDFLSISVSGSIKEIGKVDVVVEPKLTNATNPDNYDITVMPATLTITEAKLVAPSTFKWSGTPGTLSWIAITKDDLNVEYKLSLYRAAENPDGSIKKDGYGNILYVNDPVVEATTDDTSYSFLDVILEDSKDNQHAYAATIQVVPKYQAGEKHNYAESVPSGKTSLKYTAKVILNPVQPGVKSTYIGEKTNEDSTDITSKILLQGQSIGLHMITEDGYTEGSPTWSVSMEQESYVSFTYKCNRSTVLTLKDNTALDSSREIGVNVSASDASPRIDNVNATMASDYSAVNVSLAFSDVLGLASYALVKGNSEESVPSPGNSDWKEIPKASDEKAATSFCTTEQITEAGVYYVFVKDISGNGVYRANPIVVYNISFATGNESVTGTMPTLVKLKDEEIVLPDNAFQYPGYGFTNWTGSTGIYANKGKYIANQSDVLTAGWTDEKVNYTVHYHYQKLTEDEEGVILSYEEEDGTSVSFDSEYGATIAYNKAEIQASKTGYKLADNPSGVTDYASSITATENGQELHLYYNLEQYQITYKYTDTEGKTKTENDPFYYGQTVVERVKPSAVGYTFVGWDWGDSGQAPATMPNKNLTVTGAFQAEQTKYYIVYYKQNLDQSVGNAANNYLAKSFDLDPALTEEITAHYGDELAAYLEEPASKDENKETVVARALTGFTPAAVQVCYGSPATIESGDYDEWMNGSHKNDDGTVQKELSTEEQILAPEGYTNGPTYICFYYTRNLYNITMDVYKDARENDIHLFGSYYDGTEKEDNNGNTVIDNDEAKWKLPYGYRFADETSSVNGNGTDGPYKASYFETYGYKPLESGDDNAHSVNWTKRWPESGTSKDKYYLATFVDWSTGERPATMPAGNASVTREYASKELSRYVVEVYIEGLTGVTQTVTLDDGNSQEVTLQQATGTYTLGTSYERYGNAGDVVEIVDAMPAEENQQEGHIYLTVADLMKGVPNYNQYEHKPANDLCNVDGNADKELLTAEITENTVSDGKIGNVVKLRLNLVRKEYTSVVRYHKISSGTTQNEAGETINTSENKIFGTRIVKAKWGTEYLADPLYYFDGKTTADGKNEIVDSTIASTNFRTGNYIVSYSGYYWTPNSGHWPNRQYDQYDGDTGLVKAPALVMTVGGSSDGTDNLKSDYKTNNASPARSYMEVYYSAQEIDKHYYLKLQYEPCVVDSNDSSIIKESNTATDMIITSTTYPALARYGTNFQVCVANKCDIFQVESGTTGDNSAYAKYPGAYYLNGFTYTYKTETDSQGESTGIEKLRDGFVPVTLTYKATENKNMDGTGGTEVEETGTFYIPGTKSGDTFTPYKDGNDNCFLFAVDSKNQFYNGNKISYNYNSSVAAHVGRDLFMSLRPTTGSVKERANSTSMLQTDGLDYNTTPLTSMNAHTFNAYYYDVYNDYYLTFIYDSNDCSACESHTDYTYNQEITDFTCNHFSVPDGYYIAWYMDSTFTQPVKPFNIKGHTYIYGRQEKKPVENWDYAYYKLPETKTIDSKSYDWITFDNYKNITWQDRTKTTDSSIEVTTSNVDNTANITGTGQETITKYVDVSYKNEFGVETTYKGLRTEWYIDGQLVMVKQPNYSMTYTEFYMDYTKYNREGFRYDETNTRNKSKAFCSTSSVNMYAYFTRESYTLTVTRNRTKNDNDEVSTRINGATVRLEDPVKAGYTFKEWKLQEVTTDENGNVIYTDLNPEDYGYQYTAATESETGYATFYMPICNTRAVAEWTPAELPDFTITHYLQDDNQTYNPELLKQVQEIVASEDSEKIKDIIINRDGAEVSAKAYYDTELLAVSCAEDDYTYYYAGMEEPDSGKMTVEIANAFAVVQKVSDVKSEEALEVTDYKLTNLGSMYDYAFTRYQQDTTQLTLTEQTTGGGAQTFTAYIDATVEYYYLRSSSIKIRAIGLAADTSESGLTISGAGNHYYGEKVTLYATMQPNGYTFKGWFNAADVLDGYPTDGSLPDNLDSYKLKDDILNLMEAEEHPIQPITTEKNLEMTVKASGDYVAITEAGLAGTPTVTVTSKRDNYSYGYEKDTNNALTTSIDWGAYGAGANTITGYTWYYRYYDVSQMSAEEVTNLEENYADIPLNDMMEIENSDAGTYLFPTGKDAGYYVYRCVVDIQRKDNGRKGTAYGTCLLKVAQNEDYYVTYPVECDYDGNAHKYTEFFKYSTDTNDKIHIYYSETAIDVNISEEDLNRRLALAEGDTGKIIKNNIPFTDVAVNEAEKNKPVVPHRVYYYIKSENPNYASITGSETVTIKPVWLTVEAVRPFTKIYDATEKVQGKEENGTVTEGSDFHRLQTGSDGKGYYVLHGILDCDKNKTLYLDFEAAFNSPHVIGATDVTLSDMWIVEESDIYEIFHNYNYQFPNGTTLQLSGQIKPYPLNIKWVPNADSDKDADYQESDFVYNYDGTEKHPYVMITDEHVPYDKTGFHIRINNGQSSVGSYSASAEVVASDTASCQSSDYTFTLTTCKYKIIPRYIKVAPKTMSKVYNGARQTMEKTADVDEFEFYTKEKESDDWTKYTSLPTGETFSVTAADSGKNVGTYTINATNLNILNEKGKNINDNYKISYGTGTLTIVPCPVVVDNITAKDKDYDGTTSATVEVDSVQFSRLETKADGSHQKDEEGNAIKQSGLYAGDSLSLDAGKVTGTFEDAKAGTNKTVNLTIDNSGAAADGSGGALVGDAAKNYKLMTEYSQKTTTASITAGTKLTVSVADMSYVYGEQPTYSSYVLRYSGFTSEDTVDNAVSKEEANHAIFEIKKLETDGTYTTVVGDGTSQQMKSLDAGTYYIFIQTKTDGVVTGEAEGLKADNYTIVASNTPATLTVTPRPVAIEAKTGVIEKVYDATTDVAEGVVKTTGIDGLPVYYTFTRTKSQENEMQEEAASGPVNGDSLSIGSYTAVYNDANVATASTVQVTNITLAGDKKNNYILANNTLELSGEITPKDMTITVEDKETIYGEDAPEFTYMVEGAVASEAADIQTDVDSKMVVTCNYQADASAGDNRNAGDYVIQVDATENYENHNCYRNPNYNITYNNGTLTVKKRVVYYKADDQTINYGKQEPPAYTGGFVTDDTTDTNDGWCYGEGIGATYGDKAIELYGDDAYTNPLDFSSYTVQFICNEKEASGEQAAKAVDNTTPAGKYAIIPNNVENSIFARNYVFKKQSGILTIQKFYISIHNVEVLGKIYDGTRKVDKNHLLITEDNDIYTGGYPGLQFTYYEGTEWIDKNAKDIAVSEGADYVQKLMDSLDISAEYVSAAVSASSKVNVSISLKKDSYLEQRYELVTDQNLAAAQATNPGFTATQIDTTAFIIGNDKSKQDGGIIKRPLTLYPEDATIKYGEEITIATSAPESGPYTLITDKKPEDTAQGDDKEIGFAEGENFSTIGLQVNSTISPAYTKGSDVGSYTMDISASTCSAEDNYAVTYENGTLKVVQNTFPAPESVTWSATPGTITWTPVDPIGKVTVAQYQVELYKDDSSDPIDTREVAGTVTSVDLLETMHNNGAGAYTVKVRAVASTENNKVGEDSYANVKQYGAEQTSAVKYAASVKVRFSTDPVTMDAKRHSESAKIYAAMGEDLASDSYIMIAGESGIHISYSWSRMGTGSGAETEYRSGYTVDAVTASNGTDEVDELQLGTADTTTDGCYRNIISLDKDWTGEEPILITLSLNAKSADMSLTSKETHVPVIEEAMYGYTDTARPVFEALPVTESDALYDYQYQWSFTKGRYTYDENSVQLPGSCTETIAWNNKTFAFPLGQPAYVGTYEVNCTVTATRKDNGEKVTKDTSCELRINKAVADKTSVTISVTPWTYGESRFSSDGTTSKITFTKLIDDLGDVTLQYRKQSDAASGDEAGWDQKVPTDAGNYQVRAKVADSENYEGFATDPVNYAIGKAKLAAPGNIRMTKSATAPYGLVSWDAVEGPKENAGKDGDMKSYVDVEYVVTLSRGAVDATDATGATQIKTVTTTETSYDFSAQITEAGKYFVTVQAVVKPRTVKAPDEAESNTKQNYDGQDKNNCGDSEVSTFTALITIGADVTCNETATTNGFTKVYDGTSLTLTAVYGNGTETISYQWMKDGEPIQGATGSSFSITYVEENAMYACKITAGEDIIYTRNVEAKITPRPITITADSLTKTYDGTPLQTAGTTTWIIGGDGLATNDSITYGDEYSTVTDAKTVDNEVTAVTITRTEDSSTKTVYTEDEMEGVTNNYTVTKNAGTLKITARSLNNGASYTDGVTVDDIADVIYDGEEQKPDEENKLVVKDVIKDADENVLKSATLVKGTDYEVSYTDNVNTGTATVTITGKGNYTGSITKTFNILPLVVIPSWDTPDSFEYDKSQKTMEATVSNKVRTDDVAFTYEDNSNTATNAGSYQAAINGLTGTAKDNYTTAGATNLTKDWSITKAAGEVTITSDPSKVYDGTVVTDPTYTQNGTGAVTFKYYTKDENGTYTELDAETDGGKPLHAGTYYVKAFVATDTNYEAAKSAYQEVRISQRKVIITADEQESKYGEAIKAMTYSVTAADGMTSTVAPNPLVNEGDLGTITAYAKEKENDASAQDISSTTTTGEYIIHISYTENADYEVQEVTGIYTISSNRQTLVATNVTATYDGQNHESAFDHTFGGSNHPVGDGTVTITYKKIKDESGSDVTGDAQTNDLVNDKPLHAGTYEATITAAATSNYDKTTITRTVTIAKSPLKIQMKSASKAYDTQALTMQSYTLENNTSLASGDTLTMAYPDSITEVQYDAQKNVVGIENRGENVVITNSNSEEVTRDYDIENVAPGSLTVTPRGKEDGAEFKVTLSAPTGVNMATRLDNAFCWTGNDITPVVTIIDDSITGESGSLVLDKGTDYTLSETVAAKKAGTYHMKVTFQGNFRGTLDVEWKIMDETAPTGTVQVPNHTFMSILNNITFGLFFNVEQDVTITAEEEAWGSGIESLSYYLKEEDADTPGHVTDSTSAMTSDQLNALTNWNDVTDNNEVVKTTIEDGIEKWSYTFTLSPDWKGVVYTRIVDKAGHVTYLSSDGLVLEDNAPVISNVEADTTYCISRQVTVTDTYLEKVTVQKVKDATNSGEEGSPDGVAVEQTVADGTSTFTLTAYEQGTYSITATDKAGNIKVLDGIRINPEHTWTYTGDGTDKVTAACRQGTCDTYHETTNLTVEIAANDVPYTGNANVATVTESSAFIAANAGTVGEITYYKTNAKGQVTGGTKVNEAVDAGTYYAQAMITSNTGEAAYVKCAFEIKMVELLFDYNEGQDHNNTVNHITVQSIVKDSFHATVSAEEIAAVMQGVARNHYEFTGWYDAPEGGQPVTEITDLSESMTIYAHWKELVPPEGSMEVEEYNFTQFQNEVTFDHFFKETKQVVIRAKDSGVMNGSQTGATNSGIREIAYYVMKGLLDETLTPMTLQQVKELPETSWTVAQNMTGSEQEGYSVTLSIEPEAQYVIYARITDQAGNVSYIGSDGFLLENTAPVITGALQDTTYCITRTVTITDDRLDSVKVTLSDGSVVLEDADLTVTGKDVILEGREDGKSYTIEAKDKAGNVSILSGVLVKKRHTWEYETDSADTVKAVCEVKTCDMYHEAENLTVTIHGVTAPYDGKAHPAEVTVSDAFTAAGASTIGTIQYYSVEEAGAITNGVKLDGAPVHAGNYYAVAEVTADNGNTAKIICSYSITPVSLGSITLAYEECTYNGAAQENPETVTAIVDGKKVSLNKDKDYTLTSKDDTNAGQAEITVTGMGDYTGELKVNYSILPARITITAEDAQSGYGSAMAELSVRVTEGQIFEGDDLHLGAETDATSKSPVDTYEIRPVYDDNPNYEVTPVNGTYTIVKGILKVDGDGYEGIYDSQKHGIAMVPEDKDEKYTIYYSTVPLDKNNYLQKGSTKAPTFEDVGEYTVYYYIVSEHYEESVGSEQVVIKECSIGKAQEGQNCTLSINEIADTVYDGTAKQPEVVITAQYMVKNGNSTIPKKVVLKQGVDYVVTYANNVVAGTATVTATGIGNYTEVLSTTFEILPMEVELEWSEGEFVYDGTEKTVTAEIINKALPTDDVTVGTYQDNRKTEEGIYQAEALTLTGKDAGNYCIGDNSDAQYVWTIEKDIDSDEEVEKNSLALNAKLKVSQTGKKINIFWGKLSEADGYDVYVQYCGKKFNSKSLNSVNSGKITKITVTKVNGKPLNLKKNYKIFVIAYKLVDGEKVTIGRTITAHIVGRKNTSQTNVKAVKVKKSSFTLKVGGTAQVEGSTVLVDKRKNPLSDKHAKELRYASSDTEVATVSKKGKIKAVGKGTCTIYVYARNGYAKKVKVKVK